MSQKQLPQLVESMRAGGEVDTVVLPPIEINSDDEIGELARAFNDIEAVTVQVARRPGPAAAQGHGRPVREPRSPQPEPARATARTARRARAQRARSRPRSTRCSSSTTWPPACAATRRASSSCRAPSSRASGSEPIGLLDVVRSASAEIADFPRVDLVGVDDEARRRRDAPSPTSRTSSPSCSRTRRRSRHPTPRSSSSGANTAHGFVLAISDQGIGMPPEQDRAKPTCCSPSHPSSASPSRARSASTWWRRSRPATASTSNCGRGAPIGLVALVTLPAAILEREAAPEATPPVFAPHHAPDGQPTTLGARRVGLAPRRRAARGGVARRGSGRPRAPADAPAYAPTLPVVEIPQNRTAPPPPPPEAPPVDASPPLAATGRPGARAGSADGGAGRWTFRGTSPWPASLRSVDVPPFERSRCRGAADERAPAPSPREEPDRRRALRRRAAPGPRPRPPPRATARPWPATTRSPCPIRSARTGCTSCSRRHALGKRRGHAEHDDDVRKHPAPRRPRRPNTQSSDRHPEDER